MTWVGCTDGDGGWEDEGADDDVPRPGDEAGVAPCLELDDECELIRTATLASATVSTMSSAKRSTWIWMPAPCMDKLHHNLAAPTKIIRFAAARVARVQSVVAT